jgi:hypothetical protein
MEQLVRSSRGVSRGTGEHVETHLRRSGRKSKDGFKPSPIYRRTMPWKSFFGYAPKGKTPEVRQAAKRFHSSLISAINNRGYMEWMALDQPLNVEVFIRFH